MTPEEWDSMANYQAYRRPRSHPISNATPKEQHYSAMRRSGTENPPVIKTEDGSFFTYTSERHDWSHTAPGYPTNNGIPIGTQPAQQPVAAFLQAPNPRRRQQADMLTSPPWASASEGPTATPAYSSYPTPNPNPKYTNTNGSAGLNVLPADQYFATTAPHASALENSGTHRLNPGHNLTVQQPTPQYRRHYESPRHDHDARTASAITAFNPHFSSQQSYYPNTTMSMSYGDQDQAFSSYPQSAMMHDPNQEQEDSISLHHRTQVYPDPGAAMDEMTPYNPQALDPSSGLIDDIPPPQNDDGDPTGRGRSPPIPKPNREVTKGEDGRFVCTWTGCTEDTRAFNRKCEWSKHMDKHDRPYKCPAEGCEKLPGFTYSGGLLRHQREVHHLHGGPRKQLNCPHPNCKRFSGKGFSRQENLNEHLRRVHTDAGDMQNGEETEEEGSERAGMKRKRSGVRDEQTDMRQEMARLRQENEELRRTSENMMRQLQTLQTLVGAGMQQQQQNRAHQAPQAPMM